MKNRIALSAAILSLVLFFSAEIAPAAGIVPDPPHDRGSGIVCLTCHATHPDLGGVGYNNICMNCHRPGFPKGGGKPFTEADLANPFRTFTTSRLGTVYQTSHSWAAPDTLAAAGAQPPIQAAMTTNALRARTGGQLACVRCHNQHNNTYGKFLRIANDQDQLCLDCHRSRNTTSHIQGTHPVGVDYATSAAARPGLFARLSSNSPVILKAGKVLCSSCHGVHYTDSRAGTPNAASSFNNLSTSDGLLLRKALHGAAVAAGQPDQANICTVCHAGKSNHNRIGQNVQCGDCHGGHVNAGDGTIPNVWLVNRQMNFSSAVQSAKNTPVFFQSTSPKNYKDANGNGLCQACHPVPLAAGFQSFHDVATTTGCNICHTHNSALGSFSVNPNLACNACHGYPPHANHALGPDGYAVFNGTPSPFTNESSSGHATHAMSPYHKACTECHNGNSHDTGTFTDVFLNTNGIIAATGGLTPTYNAATFTCAAVYCHSNGAPRTVTTVTSPITTTPPAWNTGRFVITGQPNPVRCGFCHAPAATLATNSHARHLNSSGYAFACAVCHAATVSGADFATTSIVQPALHANGVKDVGFSGLAGNGIWTVGTATCSSVYCHSTVQNATDGSASGVAFQSPVWGNAASVTGCGACHVNMATDASGTGSHKTHAQAPYVYSCALCHGPGYTSTTIAPATHVDGSIEVTFTGIAFTGGATPTYYGGSVKAPGTGYQYCQNVYCHSTIQNPTDGSATGVTYRNPTWGNAASVGTCGGCHVNMAVDAVGTGSHYFHANAGGNGKYPCSTCHNGAGKDPNTLVATPRHVNGRINISFSGKAAGTSYARTGFAQFSSIVAGSGYGACSANICHGSGTPTWGTNTVRVTCEKCHGSAATNPFYITNGDTVNTDAKVGAHTAHLQASHNISSKISCTECHTIPSFVNFSGHMNGTTEVAFNGALARSQGTAPANGLTNCDTTWCHGGNTTVLPQNSPTARTAPDWTTPFPAVGTAGSGGTGGTTGTGLCAQCHGYPPATSNHYLAAPTICFGCHPHVNTDGTGFTDPTKHINGAIDVQLRAVHAFPYPGSVHMSDAGTDPFPTCLTSGTGCHSNNKTVNYPYPTVSGPPDCQGCHVKAPPGNGCGSCHGTAANGGRPDGLTLSTFPNVAGQHNNNHGGFACNVCHDSAGTGQTTHGNSNFTLHNDANVVVQLPAGITFTRSGLGDGHGSCNGTCSGQGHTGRTW